MNEHDISAKANNADCSLAESEYIMSYTDRFELAKNFMNNLYADNEIWQEIKETIQDVHPKIVGIFVLTETLGSIKKFIELLRACLPDVIWIFGCDETAYPVNWKPSNRRDGTDFFVCRGAICSV